MLIVGLMSGTSADGVDAALVEVESRGAGVKVETAATAFVPYPVDVRAEVLAASRAETGRVDRICRLNALLGEWFARAVFAVVQQAGRPIEAVDLVASHGQTIHHLTQPGQEPPSTLQIAEPAVIAERTGRTVVADFRSRDVAAGGQGAPLMSYVDYLLFADPARSRALQNLGGIANATFLPPGASAEAIRAFDSGPGNMVIDALCAALFGQPFDRNGAIAARGRVNSALLADLLDDPYFARPIPKTTGREQFGEQYAARLMTRGAQLGVAAEDLVATATRLTARTIAEGYARFFPPVAEVILSGGGAANPTLVAAIADELQRIDRAPLFRRPEEFGVPADAKEAIGFAVLGFQTIHGRPGTLPSATGARHPVVLGTIVPGDNYRGLLKQIGG